jgi:hypothetical protein
MTTSMNAAVRGCHGRSGARSQKQILAGSFAAFVGHPAYNTDTLCADLHRFAFLLGETDGEELFGQATP